MKKLFFVIALVTTTLLGCASNDAILDARKIDTIKKLYSKEAMCNPSFSMGPICSEFVKSDKFINAKQNYGWYSEYSIDGNATPDLKQVFDDDLACVEKYDGICTIDYGIAIQAQDLDEDKILRTVKYEIAADGSVKVNFYNFNHPVTLYYVMSCNDKDCLIDDILEPRDRENSSEYISFKARTKEALAEINKLPVEE